MPNIEFIYDRDCPNIEDARSQLRLALRQSGLSASWQEWEHHDPACPAYARLFGSPTILVAGQDIAGDSPTRDPSCRIYANTRGRNRGVPDAALIRNALQRHMQSTPPPVRRLQFAALLPAIGAALLPKLTCPVCWPAYAAILSALGVGFVDYTPYLMPLTVAFLAITLAMLAWRPRRGYAPLVLGLASSAIVLVGKFLFDSDLAVYSGVVLLVVASIWNAWPMPATAECVNCKPTIGD